MRRPREPRPWPRERRHGPQSGSRGAWCALIGFAVVCALAVNARHMLRLHAAAAAEREGGLLEAWRAEARDAWTGDAPWPRVVHSPRPTPAPSTMQAATEEIDAERAAAARAEAEARRKQVDAERAAAEAERRRHQVEAERAAAERRAQKEKVDEERAAAEHRRELKEAPRTGGGARPLATPRRRRLAAVVAQVRVRLEVG